MSKVIMTAAQLVERLEVLANRKTFYKNKWPYNLCLNNPPKSVKTFKICTGTKITNCNKYEQEAISADCVNLYKALLNGYDVTNLTVGYYQNNLSNTGDCTEWGLMKQCSEISSDFSNMGNKPRLLYMSGHIGGYIGKEVTRNGKVFNCIECTGAWGGGIIYSYIDADGTRRKCRGGEKDGKWAKNGLMTPWVDYSALSVPSQEPTPAPAPEPSLKKSNEEIAKEVKAGLWGNMDDNPSRKERLEAAGYNYREIQDIVNEMYNSSKTANNNAKYYVVKKDDTLSEIAKRNSTTVLKLIQLNPVIKNANLIFEGQKIRIR